MDADLTTADIRMDDGELSVEEVRRALDSEDPEIRRHVLTFLSILQTHVLHESENFRYGGCR